LVIAGGYGLTVWAMVVNRYFSSVARIQHDRGQVVVTRGPYRVVRHPSYAGAILAALALPIMLDAIWSLVPALVMVVALIIRTSLEDRMLREELEGYQSYTEETPYRLIPKSLKKQVRRPGVDNAKARSVQWGGGGSIRCAVQARGPSRKQLSVAITRCSGYRCRVLSARKTGQSRTQLTTRLTTGTSPDSEGAAASCASEAPTSSCSDGWGQWPWVRGRLASAQSDQWRCPRPRRTGPHRAEAETRWHRRGGPDTGAPRP
jgi:hypothetical protein